LDDSTNSQLKAELDEITKNIDRIMEKIRTIDPAGDNATEPEPPSKPAV